MPLSSIHPIFLTSPVRSHFIPDASSIVPHPLVFPSRVVARVLFHSRCSRGLPSFRTCPYVFQGVDHLIGCFVTDPSHTNLVAFHTTRSSSNLSMTRAWTNSGHPTGLSKIFTPLGLHTSSPISATVVAILQPCSRPLFCFCVVFPPSCEN